jgi:hypothetical protein
MQEESTTSWARMSNRERKYKIKHSRWAITKFSIQLGCYATKWCSLAMGSSMDVHWKTKKKKHGQPHSNLTRHHTRRCISTRFKAKSTTHSRACRLNCNAFHATQRKAAAIHDNSANLHRQAAFNKQWQHWKRNPTHDHLCCHAAQAMSSPAEAASSKSIFDTDSSQLLVDNCASASITNSLDDFVRALTKSNKCIQGINGLVTAIQVSTVSWDILDDQGRRHTIILPGTYYVPNSPHRLLSP